jgi:hypothetical protein
MALRRSKQTPQQKLDSEFARACAKAELSAAKALLAAGASIDAKTAKGWPVLIDAIYNNHALIVDLLLENGADIEQKTTEHLSKKYDETIPPGFTPLLVASHRWSNKITSRLIEAGADVNVTNQYERTPLHLAAYRGNFRLVQALVAAGADIEALDEAGNKPEALARKQEEFGVAEYLLAVSTRPKAPAPVAGGWKLLGAAEIAHVEEKPEIGQRLTDIFNFESRMFTRLAQDIKTGAQSQSVLQFDDFSDKKLLEDAHEALRELGGAETALTPRLIKKPALPAIE